MNLGIGIDPGSNNLGICVVNLDAGTPAAIPQGFATLVGRARDDAETRLEQLDTLLYSYLAKDISKALHTTQWVPIYISIEYPALSYTNKGEGKRNRHDSQFVLGMSYWMAFSTCLRYIRRFAEINPTLSVGTSLFHVTPAQASVALGCRTNAPKIERNIASAREGGGYFSPDDNRATGGALDGANPDALDAYAVAVAGWGEWKRQQLENAATLSAKGRPRHDRRTIERKARLRRG